MDHFRIVLVDKIDSNTELKFFKINEDYPHQIIPVLISNSSFIKQTWLNIIANSSNVQLNSNLQTQVSLMDYLTDKIEKKLLTDYHNIYNYQDNSELYQINFNNNNEIKQYIKYSENLNDIVGESLDVDITFSKGYTNNLKDTIIKNSLIILFILKNFYPSEDNIFTFFRKYKVLAENIVDNQTIINQFNSLSEWNNNLKIFEDTTIKDINLNLPLLDRFKELYFLAETRINNKILEIKLNQIDSIWKELRVITKLFREDIGNVQTNINFDTLEEYSNKLKIVIDQYSDIENIKNYSVDLFNTYPLILLYFFNKVDYLKPVTNTQFLKWFRNKLTNYFYLRYKRVSSFTDPLSTINGLNFYLNIDMEHYIKSSDIRDYLEKTFNNRSYYGLVRFNREIEDSIYTPITLSKTSFSSVLSSGISTIDTSSNLFELKQFNTYPFLSSEYDTSNNYITINDSNKVIVFDKNQDYKINHSDILYQVINISKIEEELAFSESTTIKYLCELEENVNLNPLADIKLLETLTTTIPYIDDISDTSSNNFDVTKIYDKNLGFDLYFSGERTIQLIGFEISYVKETYLRYTKDNDYIRKKILITDTSDGNYYDLEYYDDNDITKIVLPELTHFDFDTVELETYYLPITEITIDDADCYDPDNDTFGEANTLSEHYPYIYIKSSDFPEISTLSSLYNINGVFGLVESYSNTNNPDVDIKITFKETENREDIGTSITVNLYDNNYLPNLISLNSIDTSGVNPPGDIMDYFIQTPMIIQMKNSNNLPVFIFHNLPYFISDQNDTSRGVTREIFLNNVQIDIFKEITSSQLNRTNTELVSSGYDQTIASLKTDELNVVFKSRDLIKKGSIKFI